ncbi:MAG: 3-isopropylmalate dehydrogenase [Desulfitobacteriia bacterium]|jgi:3-isopropylmalate dehydrogenase
MPKIAVLPGDGIGQEIIPEAVKVLKAVLAGSAQEFAFNEYLVGGAAIDEVGKALPEETLQACQEADAVLLGSVGGPKWDTLPAKERPELGALLPLRKHLKLYANIRPVKVLPALLSASTLKEDIVKDVDLVVFRELTGGLYFGEKGRNDNPPAAYDVLIYTEEEIRRILKLAFQNAQGRRKKVCSVDKANVLESSRFWREIATDVAKEFPEVELTHMYVDNAAMQLVRAPGQFDVIVTENMFGDILTDLASMLGGSIGMLASASMSGSKGLFEPAHGSAPDIAGKNIANPLATILSGAMMLRYSFNLDVEAERIERAVLKVLEQGLRTADLAKAGDKIVGTKEMGDAVVAVLA